jgi:endoglucanase
MKEYGSMRRDACWTPGRLAVLAAVVTVVALRADLPLSTNAPPMRNPLAGATFYVGSDSAASRAAARLAPTDSRAATLLRRIHKTPTAAWVGDWFSVDTVAKRVESTMSDAASAGALPVLVLYAIPHRDCGGYSAGGLASPSAYHDWVEQVVSGIGTRRAAVIVEPDALPSLTMCLNAAGQRDRLSMIRDAVRQLAVVPSLTVYLDAGHSRWQDERVMAARLQAAGVEMARGFSLNVANFFPTREEEMYGDHLGHLLGEKHYVVDTSRNGRGPASTWCNPPGQGLGVAPTTATTGRLADAYLWIKHPGVSDGGCNGGPPAGQWWTSYALGLAERAEG